MKNEEMTCGKGLAEHAVLPATLSKLATSMADVLETHIPSLDRDDPNSRPEREAYARLVDDHHSLANTLRVIADRMAGYRDLPMAVHDESVLGSAEAVNAFAAFVQNERAVLDLLRSSLERDDQLLAEMRQVH